MTSKLAEDCGFTSEFKIFVLWPGEKAGSVHKGGVLRYKYGGEGWQTGRTGAFTRSPVSETEA